MAEMARVQSDFVFARRSYLRDTAGRDLVEEGARLRTLWCQLNARDAARVARDHDEFVERFGQSWAR
jgi:hypothetical protein